MLWLPMLIFDSDYTNVQRSRTLGCKVQMLKHRLGSTFEMTFLRVQQSQHYADRIVIEEVPIEEVEDFCYLRSVMSSNSICDKEIKTRMGKANAVFGSLEKIWKSNGCSVDTKVRLYMSL